MPRKLIFPWLIILLVASLDFQRRLLGKGGLLQISQLGGWDTRAKALRQRVASAPPGDSEALGCSEVHPQARSHEAGQGHRLELRGVSAEELEGFLKASKSN